MYSVVKTQWRGYVELLSSLVHNRIGCCPFWYADATIHLVELLLFHLFLLFFLFHNYNTIIMLTRCVRWSRPVLLWNIVCSSVNVVHQLLVELHFLFFFLFHNDMSFKLFIISVAKLRNKIENAETKREKCWSKREKCWSGTGDRSVSYPFFSGYERNEAFPQDIDLSTVPGWSEGGDTLKQLELYNS